MLQAVSTLSTSPASFPVISETAIGNVTTQSVNARDLHAFLEVGKDFSNWIRARIDQFDFVRGQDFEVFAEIGEQVFQGVKGKKEYALTLDMAKELSMVERNARGKAARRYFIECERRLLDQKLATSTDYPYGSIADLSTEATMVLGLLLVADSATQTMGQVKYRMRSRGRTNEDTERAVAELVNLHIAGVSESRGTKYAPVFDVFLLFAPSPPADAPTAIAHQQEAQDCPVMDLARLMDDLLKRASREDVVRLDAALSWIDEKAAEQQPKSMAGALFQLVSIWSATECMDKRHDDHGHIDRIRALSAHAIAFLVQSGVTLPEAVADWTGLERISA